MNYLNDTCCIHTADIWWNTSYKATFTPKNEMMFSLIEEYLWHGQFPALITWSGVLQQGTSNADAVGFDMPVVQSPPAPKERWHDTRWHRPSLRPPQSWNELSTTILSTKRRRCRNKIAEEFLWQPKIWREGEFDSFATWWASLASSTGWVWAWSSPDASKTYPIYTQVCDKCMEAKYSSFLN
jgi:hypothetical protein